MEIVDKRKFEKTGDAKQFPEFPSQPEKKYDAFRPTLEGFVPDNDCVLLRELILPEEGMIVAPDAYAEDCLFAEVLGPNKEGVQVGFAFGTIVRILKGVGHTIPFVDGAPGQRYFTVHVQDIIGHWSAR